MRTVSVTCDRCGAAVIEGRSILEAKAGSLTRTYANPIDLCGPCADRFVEFLAIGRADYDTMASVTEEKHCA